MNEAGEEVSTAPNLRQQSSSPFLEISCKISGKVRRFSVGTEAGFALQYINQKLVFGEPSASYIEAVKQGQEPIVFGPNSVLVDYGDGWTLHTAIDEGFEGHKVLEEPYEDFPTPIEPMGEDVQSATDLELQLLVAPLPEESKTTSGDVRDTESQSSEKLDFTDTFTTNLTFYSRDELIKWARDIGKTVGMVVIIKKSEFGVSGRTARIYFACERFGQRREYKRQTDKNNITRKRVSKRCNCPFLLRGMKLPQDDHWKLKVECGHHNHPLERHLQGSSVAGKLTPEEKVIVTQMLRLGMKPKDILKVLKERDERNESTVRTIYNAQAKLRLEEMSARSQCNSS